MNLISNQIESIKKIFQKHEKYHHFSGVACIITGVLWLINEGINHKIQIAENYPDYCQVLSWMAVASIAVILSAILTVYERNKRQKKFITLSLKTIFHKFIFIILATFALIFVFYQNSLIPLIPALFMLMYGLLILTSKESIIEAIKYFGYVNLVAGIAGLVFSQFSIVLAALVLGAGHIIIGITLTIYDREDS